MKKENAAGPGGIPKHEDIIAFNEIIAKETSLGKLTEISEKVDAFLDIMQEKLDACYKKAEEAENSSMPREEAEKLYRRIDVLEDRMEELKEKCIKPLIEKVQMIAAVQKADHERIQALEERQNALEEERHARDEKIISLLTDMKELLEADIKMNRKKDEKCDKIISLLSEKLSRSIFGKIRDLVSGH